MTFIQFEAMPTESAEGAANTAGAYVNCHVPVSDRAEAEAVARRWIEEAGWVVVAVEEWRPLDVDAEIDGPNGRYVREAVEDGGCLVFHRWPPEGEPPVA